MRNQIPYFDLRANYKRLYLDTLGHWSYPIFIRANSNKILWMYIILKSRTNTKNNTHYLFKPHAILLTPPNSKQVIKFESLKHGNDPFPKIPWDKVLGRFPHSDIQTMSVKEFKKKEKLLLELCIKESEKFNTQNSVSGEFKVLWQKMCNPLFLKFIEYLSPGFHDLFQAESAELEW